MKYNKKKPFPNDFFWGASTAAYQVEGAYLTDGKTLSVVDKNIEPSFANTSITSDHYHRYVEDIALMKELGMASYRFSIAWTRILPLGRGEVNQEAINFYNNLINELLANDIEPLVTIYHFDLPDCLQAEYGGFSSRKIIADFEYYCHILFEHFGDRVKHWLTINEQSNMFLLPYLVAFDSQQEASNLQQKYQMNHIMTLAHAKAIMLCRKMLPHAKIGPALGISPVYPATPNPEDVLAAQDVADLWIYLFLDLYCKGSYHHKVWSYLKENDCIPTIESGDLELLQAAKPDFIGINYYESKTVKYAPLDAKEKVATLNKNGVNNSVQLEIVPGFYERLENPFLPKTDWDWSIDATALRISLNEIYARYQLPIIITENGMGAVDTLTADKKIHDNYRIDYLRAHIEQLQLTVTDGVEILGYYPWSFMDVLSTTSGFRKRYGFVYVNRTDDDLKDLARYKKDSFYWYQRVIQSNGDVLE